MALPRDFCRFSTLSLGVQLVGISGLRGKLSLAWWHIPLAPLGRQKQADL